MRREVLLFIWFLFFASVCGQVSYSIPEEMEAGSLVGNVARDLGLDFKRLKSGRVRLHSGDGAEYIELNRERGVLLIKRKIDREALCGETTPCALHFQMILENPIELFRITIEITDINDNAPSFSSNEKLFEISESVVIGSKFVLEKAIDADIGANGLQNYVLKPVNTFALKLENQADGSKKVEMILQKPLDREQEDRITLLLTAVDGGQPPLSGTMQITVNVLDANDNAPIFSKALYKAMITENSPRGTTVTVVSAFDKDGGSNGEISYTISKSKLRLSDLFQIDRKTGEVVLIGEIDYEKVKIMQIDIEATDNGGLSDSSKILIDIIDVNDNSPQIQILSKSDSVLEDSPVNTVITMFNVNDPDSDRNGEVRCNINEDIPFTIKNDINGFYSLVTEVALDREATPQFNITLTCSDEGVPSLSANVTLTLQISDVNDNAPVFQRTSYEAYIVENNPPGVSIFTVKATDTDWNQNARVSYILEDSAVNGVPISSYVSVSADSGVIHAVRSFDYEQIKDFNFYVKAQDGGSPPLSSNVTVKILIQDQNDNPPQVLYPVQTGGSLVAEMVPRSADVGYLVTKVVAVDVDSGQNAWLSYKLQKTTDRALFEVGLQNGEIRTIRQVTDKDAVKQRLTVIVEDNGQPSRSATVIVNVAVTDSFPEVLSEFTDFSHDKEYNENLTFYLVLALAVVSFLFITCVVVIISVKIYRWKQSRILYHSNLPVIPYYPPRYSDTLGTGTLPHVYNYEVCRTTDSRKSDCKFGRAGNQNVLIMDPSSTGTMQRMQSEKSILDEPDSPLEKSYYEAYIVENNAPSVSIFTVKATDVDWNQNSRVSYILEDSSVNGVPVSSLVSVSADSGVIHAVRSFDYEQIKDFQFLVKAQDGGSPPHSSNVTVKILIQDQNDNPPQVLYPVQTGGSVVAEMVPRSADVGYLVTKVVAVDVDSGQNAWLSYKLQKTTDRALFEVGLENGEIRTIRQVTDKDAVKQRLTVIVEDNGQPSRSATVIVNVAVADSFPEVLSEFTDFSQDKEYNDNLTFYLVLALAVVSFLFITCLVVIISVKIYRWRQSRFLYHSNLPVIPYYPPRYSDTLGTGTLPHVYNYEVCRTTDSRKSDCKFGRAGSQNVLVMDPSSTGMMPRKQNEKNILDEPDSPLENNTPGMSIFTVKATDADWNQNARVSYILEDSSVNGVPVSSYVSVGADSGVIHAVRSFDYEQIKDFQFRIKAQDGGSPPLGSNVTVKILIQDQNDNPPQVLYPVQTGGSLVAEMVPRSADVGYLVTKVVAVDVDSGQNAWLSYKLQKTTDRALFEVGLQNGEIRTIRQVTDKDAVKQRLTVIVEDNGQPSRSATVIVNVAVADSFPEVFSEFTDFTQDKEYNDNLTFYLVLALAVVSFLFITCVVVIISVKIYRWKQSRILYHSNLPVIPYYPPRYSDTLGTATLPHVYNYEVCRTTDSRKSDCKFGRAGSQNILVMDPSSTGTMQRMQIEKSILDEPDSPLEFEVKITPTTFSSADSGVIHAVRSFDYEQIKDFQFLVKARDGGSPPLSSNVTVKILILDQNDNPPQVLYPVQTGGSVVAEMVPRSADVGYLVTKVVAVDVDSGQNAWLSYKLQKTTDRALFEVGLQNGEIRTIRQVTDKDAVKQRLTVIVEDNGQPSRSATVIVNVAVADSFPEVLSEFTEFSQDKEYNDNLTFYLVLALAVVSFLFITCVVVIISVKIYRWRQSRVLYHSNLPVIPYYPPRYSDTLGTGTLPHVYNYEVCRTTDSRKSDCKFGRAGCQNVLIMDPSSTGTMQKLHNEKNILDEPDSPLEIILENPMEFYSVTVEITDINDNAPSFEKHNVKFKISDGVIHAVRSFDYEQIKDFQFLVKAQDGGSPPLSSNVTVKILIQDQNDNPPQVLYPVQTGGSVVAEMVPRSADVGYLVTKVVAVDVDSGQNAWLSYKLQKTTDRALFEVGLQNGEIRTIRQVTDKDAVKQRLTVIVEDNGQPSRSATVIVNVAVADSFPEVLSEFTEFSQDKEYNDNLTFYLVLALAVVSFLFITCVVVIISVKIYRWKQSRILYHSNLPVIPYYPPRYSDTLGTGTLPHVYNYEVCRTTDSRKSDCKIDRAGYQNVLIMDPSSTGTMQRIQNEKSILDEPDSPLEVLLTMEAICCLTIRKIFPWLPLILCICLAKMAFCQVRYSIPEEMATGSVVGNIIQDLGLDIKRLKSGKARIFTEDGSEYIGLNAEKGTLVVVKRIDREELCKQVSPCSLHSQIILENPMELHRIDVEIIDVNDNAPFFSKKEYNFQVSESASSAARYSLESAIDLDVAQNTIQTYKLNPTDNFKLNVLSRPDGTKYIEMVLHTLLDREDKEEHKLTLTAFDGGKPQKSGSVKINVIVLDANDNAPVFSQSVYKVTVPENTSNGTVVLKVSATDIDKGANEEVTYSFSHHIDGAAFMFNMDPQTGEMTVAGVLDYEKDKHYEIDIKATDKGGLADTSKVQIEVTDLNDNAPVINIISLSNPIPEDSALNTVIAMINIKDLDSGKNGQVRCFISRHLPFKIKSSTSNFYSLISDDVLDRETVSEYNITITAMDEGSPPYSTNKSIHLQISDVNDNSPVFSQNELIAFIVENNSPGIAISSVKASDTDYGSNSRISYFLEDFQLNGMPVSAYFSVNAESGEILAVRSFDYEQTKEFRIRVKAQDGGSPPLSSNVTVKILIQDQNDNPPQVLYPVQTGGSVLAEMVPRSADVGYLVTKVVAVDVDSGQNAWLSYKLQKTTDRALFEVGLQNGEIRTIRQVTDKDAVKQRLTVIVEDNGQPSRSATVIVNVAVADSFPEVLSEFTDFSQDKEYTDNLTFYLVLALAVVSFLFITCLVVIISVKIYRWRQERIFYKSSGNLPVIPYYPSLYADAGGTGTLKQGLSYEVYGTTDSRMSDVKCSGPFSQCTLSVDHSGTRAVPRHKTESENSLTELRASDSGKLPLTSENIILLKLSDVNDNAPLFSQTFYIVYTIENHVPGSIYSVTATDLDEVVNSISYSKLDSKLQDVSVSSYVYINSDNGSIYSMHLFDYEKLKVFQILVQAKDQGSPSLSSNATVHVFILDQNDNALAVIYPSSAAFGSLSHQKMPTFAKAGHLVTKVTAVDANSGHNAWISYRLVEATDASLFTVNLYTGEVRTKRAVSEQDESSQRLIIEIKDDGEPVQSATVTVSIQLDGLHEPILDLRHKVSEPSKKTGRITLYLILSLASVSVLSLVTFLVLAVKCIRNSRSSGSCCMRRSDCDDYKNPNRNLQLQLNTDGPIKYVEVLGGDMMSQSQSFRSCMSPMSEYSDFTLIKPSSTTDFKEVISVLDASLPDSTWTFESQQVSRI
ncbi:LOW QUALITY PROTEIN: uncharacterized protein FYW49_005876 [Xenentodon cancila]